MEIKEFIKKTLMDLTSGLSEASSESEGKPKRFVLTNTTLRTEGAGDYGLIEFDLAVTARRGRGAGASGGFKIAVLQATAGKHQEFDDSSTSRIKFVVEDRQR